MKSVTEFASFTLKSGLSAKTALAAEGKSTEEVHAALGERFKLEGDKLKHFVHSLDVAEKNAEDLKRVLVLSLAEGEKAPAKAVQVEESYYVPEFHVVHKPAAAKKEGGRGKGRGGRGGGRKEKESPWGAPPEQKAAKSDKGGKGKADAKPV